ncbi:MAG: imidazole glycerol phosphate synthase subunit HisF [Actinobacteria bacterium]|uniref:imidazole glycerol-phosphate synthase n=1 Tax=freshwater metagenome TaxID=449393 RepID=A0A6J6HY45_9ZZZZ|nr:imidazole glycerol phosphate synthase subunit HisF [Actinomycetota bacterium]
MPLSIRVIPCLDVADGRVVKGVNFLNLKDAGDPIELAAKYYADGADELTFLDVHATVDNRSTMYDLVTSCAEKLFIPLTVGGGIREVDDVAKLLGAGADKISVGSAGISNPSLLTQIADRFGNQVLVISLDLKRSPNTQSGYLVTTHGGRNETDLDALEWVKHTIELGAGELLVNSIDADGTRKGFDKEMLEAIKSISSVPVIASGGAGSAADFPKAATAGADAILAASIFHEGSVSIAEAKAQLKLSGYETR